MTILRWLGRNLSTLLLAFVLAVVVWVSAVLAADPNINANYSRAVTIEVIGQDAALLQVSQIPTQARLTINAPQSIWNQINANTELVQVWVDLSGLGPGQHTVPVRTQIRITPAQVVKVEPTELKLTLEPLSTRTLPVQVVADGDPALGYRRGEIQVDPIQVSVSGPQSLVEQVSKVQAAIGISGATDNVKKTSVVQALNANGEPVSGVSVMPQSVSITQMVSLLGGYRNVVVKVVTTSQVANGYWLTNLSVTPPNVTVFSKDPQLVNGLPGYVETKPIDLNGLSDDTDIRADLNLPEGVSLVGEQSVLVRVGIAALEGSLTISLVPEATGLPPELAAEISPETIDIILSGPLPILYSLSPASVRVTVNLAGLEPGTYQVMPVVDLLPNQILVESMLPETVEVTIGAAPTATPTSRFAPTAAPTATPTPTPLATFPPVILSTATPTP